MSGEITSRTELTCQDTVTIAGQAILNCLDEKAPFTREDYDRIIGTTPVSMDDMDIAAIGLCNNRVIRHSLRGLVLVEPTSGISES